MNCSIELIHYLKAATIQHGRTHHRQLMVIVGFYPCEVFFFYKHKKPATSVLIKSALSSNAYHDTISMMHWQTNKPY